MTTPRLLMVHSFALAGSNGRLGRLEAAGETLYFRANDGASGYELWTTDGETVSRIADLNPGPAGSNPNDLVAVGDALFFVANDGNYELWKANGNTAGRVVDLNGDAHSLPTDLTAVGNSLFFVAKDNFETALWRTDGNSVRRLSEGDSNFRYLTPVGDTVFFQSNGDGSKGLELWKTNGNTVSRVTDLYPGSGSAAPDRLTAVGDTLFFRAQKDATAVRGLWETDGRAVSQVGRIVPSGNLYGFASFKPLGSADTLFFSGSSDGASDFELWATDGTTLRRIADINPGPGSSDPDDLTVVGDTLFFRANDGASGVELWHTDGTTTSRVADIYPGSGGSDPRYLTAVGDTLFFAANDGESGFELWRTDGTTTSRVADIIPGSGGSDPNALTAIGKTLYFSAGNATSGYSLWALDLEDEPRPYVCFSGGGWNTHSLLAGLFAGALDAMEARGSEPAAALSDLMENVEGIGAISGGSWFLSHLAYSDAFNQNFDSKTERDNYNLTGYNGLLARLINAAISARTPRGTAALRKTINGLQNLLALDPDPINLFAIDALDALDFIVKVGGFLGEERLDWRSFVENLVYGPFAMKEELANTALTDARQDWAQEKDLVIATGLSTGDAVLHSNLTFPSLPSSSAGDFEADTYTLLGSAEPSLKEAQGRPLGLLSTVSDKGKIRAYADDPGGGDLTLSYRSALLPKRRAERTTVTVEGPIPLSPQLSIIDATVASSSALAALAQPEASGIIGSLLGGQLPLASAFRSLAPMATLRRRGTIELDIPSATANAASLRRQLKNSIAAAEVRLMDGGYLDNAPAAYLLRQIQQEQGSEEPFELTLFFNSSIDPLTGVRMNVAERGRALSDYRLPNDLTQLFGRTKGEVAAPAGTLVDGPFPALANRMPSAQIFAESAWRGERKPQWQFQRDSVEVRYFELDVRTVANRQFGIVGGQSGRVHLFVSNNSESFAAPYKRSHLDEYRQNYNLAREAISTFGGAELMLEALGVAETV